MKRPSDYLEGPIWFHRQFVDFTQSITAALMLSRGLHWSRHTADPERWFYKSRDEWQRETGMTRFEQEGARKILRELKVWGENWEQKTNRMWYRVDLDRLDELLLEGGSAENPPTPIGVGGKPSEGSAENQHHLSSTEEDIQKKTATELTEVQSSIQKPSSLKPSPSPSLSLLMNDAAFLSEWGFFIEHRKKLKKPLTGRAEQIILKKLEQRPQRAVEALQKCMEKGWQSFEWEYLDQQPRNSQQSLLPQQPVRGRV